MLKTRIAQWEKELLEKGIKQGIEKGKMSMLERQLVLKFGSLPDWAKKKFENASADQLEDWALKIFDAAVKAYWAVIMADISSSRLTPVYCCCRFSV